MIFINNNDKLVRIYFYFGYKFEEIQFYSEGFINNCNTQFTDNELITIYHYLKYQKGHIKVYSAFLSE